VDRALTRLRAAPAAPLAGLGLALLVFAMAHDDRPSIWRPVSLVLIGLLAVAGVAVPVRWRSVPLPVRIALIAFAAFTVWSFVAMAWADSRGDAWDGANRTLAYLVVFSLFALWPLPPRAVTVLLGLWTTAIAVIGLVVLLRLSASHHPASMLVAQRLSSPLRYQNASAAMYLMAMWPAVLFAARRDVVWPVRGVAAGAAVLLADLALLSQSRGSVIAVALCVPVLFLIAADRVRAYLVVVPVAAGVAATAAHLLHAGNRYGDGDLSALRGVATPVLVAAAVVAVAVAVVAVVDARWRAERAVRSRARRLVAWVAVATAVAVVAGGLVAAGDPARRARHAWHSFTHGYGPTRSQHHLASGLGSNRRDFYRVAWGQFRRAPITGAGTDQFFQDYLARGHSTETPHYPHSIELRTVGELGLVGAVLLSMFMVAAGWAVARARRGPPASAALVVAGAMAFALWLIQGTADWFFEIFAVSAPAFALLGIACSFAPRAEVAAAPAPRPWLGRVAVGVGGVALLAAAASLALPWIASRDIDRAAKGWQADPAAAFRQLDRAADLNPLSSDPQTTAGTIALYQGDLGHADRAFRAALKRDARDDYATLEIGAIAGARGDWATATRYLQRAHQLYPHDQLAIDALARVRAHKRVNLKELNDVIGSKFD
jgi:O-Antigen ligase